MAAAALIAGAGAGVLLFDAFGRKTQRIEAVTNVMTQMSINATTRSATECFQSLSSEQSIDIHQSTSKPRSEQILQGCEFCQHQLNAIYRARMKLEDDAANYSGSNYNEQTPNADLKTMMTAAADPTGDIGPCTLMCSDVVTNKISQDVTLSATASCDVKESVKTNVSENIQAQLQASIKNQQDVLGQLTSGLQNRTASVVSNLTTVMTQNITNEFIQSLRQTMYVNQQVNITGNSIVASNFFQAFNGSMVSSLQVTNTVLDQLRQSASYSVAQAVLNKNDTIGDISRAFLGTITTMSHLLQDISGQILVIIGCVLFTFTLVIGSLYVFNHSFRDYATHRLEAKVTTAPAPAPESTSSDPSAPPL